MYIIPRITPNTLPDTATASAWQAEGIRVVHFMLEPTAYASVDGCIDFLRAAGFSVQVEMTIPDGAEALAERLAERVERLFVPFALFALPRVLLALIERYGSFVGVSLAAEEGMIRIPLPIEPNMMPLFDAVRTLETAGVISMLYRDLPDKPLPLISAADITMRTNINFYADGALKTPDDLLLLDQMKLMGWTCLPMQAAAAAQTLRNAKAREH